MLLLVDHRICGCLRGAVALLLVASGHRCVAANQADAWTRSSPRWPQASQRFADQIVDIRKHEAAERRSLDQSLAAEDRAGAAPAQRCSIRPI